MRLMGATEAKIRLLSGCRTALEGAVGGVVALLLLGATCFCGLAVSRRVAAPDPLPSGCSSSRRLSSPSFQRRGRRGGFWCGAVGGEGEIVGEAGADHTRCYTDAGTRRRANGTPGTPNRRPGSRASSSTSGRAIVRGALTAPDLRKSESCITRERSWPIPLTRAKRRGAAEPSETGAGGPRARRRTSEVRLGRARCRTRPYSLELSSAPKPHRQAGDHPARPRAAQRAASRRRFRRSPSARKAGERRGWRRRLPRAFPRRERPREP